MDLKGAYAIVSDFLGGLINLLSSLLAVGVLVEVLYGSGSFGFTVVKNLTAMISSFGEHGFAGLLALLILVAIYKK